jgi:glycosyltransferase involved in cell wall biosynthesis
MLISVIVPHLNQEDYLRVGLTALRDQEDVTSEVEVIVVDNGSRRMPEEVCADFPGTTLLREDTPGPGPARNLGVEAAKGDILAFIDADCRAHPRWLHEIETAFTDQFVRVIGGDVQVGYVDPAKPTFLEPYEAIYSYRNDEHIAEGFSGAGNLAMRAEIMAKVGPFAGLEVAEDRDWGLRAVALGEPARYIPGMIVYHPARPTFADLARKWDRHIAHDLEDFLKKPAGMVKWLARAVAVGGSWLIEIPRVITSHRIAGAHQRWLAFLCLARVRIYRGWRMLTVAFSRNTRAGSMTWNRD